jgi:hypothetical protein
VAVRVGIVNTFTVQIDVELRPEVVDGIRRAIQRAVLIELAGIDVAPEYSVALRPPKKFDAGPIPDGTTDGIWIRDDEFTP